MLKLNLCEKLVTLSKAHHNKGVDTALYLLAFRLPILKPLHRHILSLCVYVTHCSRVDTTYRNTVAVGLSNFEVPSDTVGYRIPVLTSSNSS